MKKILLVTFSLLVVLCAGCAPTAPTWTEPYPITGTEHSQLWAFPADDLLSELNSRIPKAEMQLKLLKDFTSSSPSLMLTLNGSSYKVCADTFNDADASSLAFFTNESDFSSWIGYIEDVEVDLYSYSTADAEANGYYIRGLINIFTPGVEERVEDVLGLYGEPHPDAVISDSIRRVLVGDVQYTYVVDDRFIAEPNVREWPEPETAPSAIRPS